MGSVSCWVHLGFATDLLDTGGWCGLCGSGKVVFGLGPVL